MKTVECVDGFMGHMQEVYRSVELRLDGTHLLPGSKLTLVNSRILRSHV